MMWRLSPLTAAKSRTYRRRRHIIAPDTYLESPGFAQNFPQAASWKPCILLVLARFGEEFREDVVFRGIQEHQKPLA